MKYINRKLFIWLLLGFSIAFYLLYLLLFPLTINTFLNYLKPITTVVTFDTILVFLFARWIWKFKFLHSWLVPFPNLNGTWKGVIKTNWIDEKTGKKPNPIPVILTIKQSFTNISCVMRTVEMNSFSFISGFVIDKENQILRLVYTYDNIPKQTFKDRSPQHFGTIFFDIVNNGNKKELSGDYWTGRETTGSVELEFWKKEHLEKYPEELGQHPVSEIRKDD
jgi:hypothetical protein